MKLENQGMQIAERIRGLRQIVGLSVNDMALLCNVSTADYEKSESGENDFSFSFLQKCANALKVDVAELISGEAPRLSGYEIVRNGEGLPLERRQGFHYQHLASFFKNKTSEPFLITAKYDAQAEQNEIPLSWHGGEEFNYVISGSLKVRIEDHVEILGQGDSIYYNSGQGHGMVAAGGQDTVFLAVVMERHGEQGAYHSPVQKQNIVPTAEVAKNDSVYNKFVDTIENEKGELLDIRFKPTKNFNFGFDVVDAIAEKNPDKAAMVWVSVDGLERTFSFSDMSRYSNMTANYFKSLGIKKGDKVMLVLKRHYQFWFAMVALHKLGAIAIPATNLLTKKDFIYRFDAAGVSGIVCTGNGDVAGHADDAIKECPQVSVRMMANGRRPGWNNFDEDILKFSDVFVRPTGEEDVTNDDIMLMYFTSGTTGYPKIATHSFTYPLGHVVTAKYWHNVNPDGLHFTISDTGWAKSVWGKIYGQWLCEAAVFTYDFDKFATKDILPKFAKHKITTFCAPPTMYRFFIQEDLSQYDLSSLQHCTIAGEALNPEVFNKFLGYTGNKLMEGYGQTELTLVVANLVGMEPKPGSMGKPNPMFDVEILNAEGEPAKVGEVGEIVVKTDKDIPCGMFLYYYKEEEKTKSVWDNGIYHTGDVAWRDEDGYYWYVGRTDDLIKSSGYRIGPFEIENVLMEHKAVLECAVTGVPDELRGQAVKATIVLTKEFVASDELKKDIQDFVKNLTAPYKYPRIIEFVDELPKTISGKIRRVEIRDKEQK